MFSNHLHASDSNHSEIKFKSGNITLRGYFTTPKAKKKFPAVLLLEGSGQSTDKVETSESSFRQIAEFLATFGVGSLRYNKRGSGYNSDKGQFHKATLEDNYRDAKNALVFLKSQSNVNSKKIFVLGQSMGGTRASRLANDFAWIKGVILVASPTRTFSEFNNDQLSILFRFKGMTENKIKEELKKNTNWIENIISPSYLCEKDIKCQLINGVEVVDGQSIEFWKQTVKHNQLKVLSQLKQPILIIQGTSDWVVSVKDTALAATTLEDVGHLNYQVNIINGFDHFFANNPSKVDSLKYMIGVKTKKLKPMPLHKEFQNVLKSWLIRVMVHSK